MAIDTQTNIDFSSLPFQFVEEESGGQYLPIDLGNGQQVFKTASGYEISGPLGGSIYDSTGNLVNTYERTGSKTGIIKDTAGNVVGSIDSSSRLNQALGSVFDPLAPAIPAVLGSLVLGPAGSGLFSAPVAAAASTGGSTLLHGGSIEDALKNAALAGALGYGIENLFPSDALKAGKTAVDLASSGGTVDSITQALVDSGVSSSTARTIAAEALAGSSASQIASDFAGLTLGGAGSTSLASTAANPNLVNVLGSSAPTAGSGLISSIVSAAPAIIPSLATMAGTAPAESVTVQGQNLPQTQVTTQDLLTALTPAITATLPAVTGGTQSVEVPGSKTTTTENIISGIVPALTTAVVPGTAPAPAPAPASQPPGDKVEVIDKKDKPIPSLGPSVLTPLPPVPPQVLTELPKPTQPPDKKSVFTPSDILNIIGILGGVGATTALSNTGTGTVSTPPSDTMIGSTTPQFGPDYYAAVQRYYNAYMPETPRNVATPLQQWYENKFGA